MTMDGAKQFVSRERLGQILLSADDAASGLVEQAILRAEHDDRRASELWIVLDERASLIAVESRHHDVDEDDRGLLVGDLGERLETVHGRQHVATFFLEQGLRG